MTEFSSEQTGSSADKNITPIFEPGILARPEWSVTPPDWQQVGIETRQRLLARGMKALTTGAVELSPEQIQEMSLGMLTRFNEETDLLMDEPDVKDFYYSLLTDPEEGDNFMLLVSAAQVPAALLPKITDFRDYEFDEEPTC